jgi:predicted phage baseplate assembly protein
MANDPTLHDLNDCGCCQGVTALTPLDDRNRPGLSAIAYRIGVYSDFKVSMESALTGTGNSALSRLKTRDDDDFSIALLDSWAVVADVLTFYQERIANESYLRTANERRSIVELARELGYELNPGVAAGTYLAFTVEHQPGAVDQQAPGAPAETDVPVGTKVQTIPGPGEKPQTFETVEAITAKVGLNQLSVRQTEPRIDERELSVAGTATNLKPGDFLLFVNTKGTNAQSVDLDDPASGGALRAITSVEPDQSAGLTLIRWEEDLDAPLADKDSRLSGDWNATGTKVFALRQRASLFGYNAQDWCALPVAQRVGETNPDPKTVSAQPFLPGAYSNPDEWAEATPVPGTTDINLDAVYNQIVKDGWVVLRATIKPPPARVCIPQPQTTTGTPVLVETATLARAEAQPATGMPFAIESVTPAGSPASQTDTATQAYRAVGVAEEPVARFNMSGKTTKVTLPPGASSPPRAPSGPDRIDKFSPRNTAVYAASEELKLAEMPIRKPVHGSQITLDGQVIGIQAGQRLIVSGITRSGPRSVPSDTDTQVKTEMVVVKDTSTEGGRTLINLTDATPLQFLYEPASVAVYGNVAVATNGETTSEVLGSGDATVPYQRFNLRQSPLTYTSAPTASGGASTLEVRVDNVKWTDVPTLFGRGPRERVYVTRIDDTGKVSVVFGDGRTGARLPQGIENISAAYRKGTGLPGMVKANQLSLLMTRPLGLKSVTNPTAPTGAQDPQVTADAKKNAPTTVLTLDRVVSLSDYEDFARNFSGIAKALATWTWNVHSRGVFLTVAGPGGSPVPEDSQLHDNLLNAIQNLGNPSVPVLIESFSRRSFKISAQVKVDSAYESDLVLAAVAAALESGFSFDARDFGQPVTLSEVFEIIQSVPGVVAVDITRLLLANPLSVLIPFPGPVIETLAPTNLARIKTAAQRVGIGTLAPVPPIDTPATLVSPILPARAPQPGDDAATTKGAELLILDLNPSTDLGVMK